MIIYKLLTFLIMLLAKLRHKWGYGKSWVIRKDRDEANLIPGYSFKGKGIMIICCDCGLGHRFFEDDKGIHCLPERPEKYDYKWRL